jgi:putative transposase
LPTFSGTTIEEINKALKSWINNEYHHKKHSSTGQKPIERFASNMECIRIAPSNLTDYFRKTVRRKVAKDRTVTINGNMFEAPVCLIGKRVELLYHDETPFDVEVKHDQKSYGLITRVDVHVNCRVKRHKWREGDIQISNNTNEYKGGSLLGGKDE